MPRSGDEKVLEILPSASSTKVARFAHPRASLNTPYSFATAPCGQKSDSTGNVYPCCSAQVRWAWRVSQLIASTWAPARSNAPGSSRISHSSPSHTPVKVNG